MLIAAAPAGPGSASLRQRSLAAASLAPGAAARARSLAVSPPSRSPARDARPAPPAEPRPNGVAGAGLGAAAAAAEEGPRQQNSRVLLPCGTAPDPRLARSGSDPDINALSRISSWQDFSVASAYAAALERAGAGAAGGPAAARPQAQAPGGPSPEQWRRVASVGGAGAAAAGALAAGAWGSFEQPQLQQLQQQHQQQPQQQQLLPRSAASTASAGALAAAAADVVGKVDKKRCAAPGCTQRFDVRHLKALLQRHYCGRCQRAFCLAHTAYSTHGPSGQCGADSGCLCFACYGSFTPAYRSALSMHNTLRDRQRTLSGPPGAGGRGGGDPRRANRDSSGSGGGGGGGGDEGAGGRSGSVLWRRGLVKLLAVGRFQRSRGDPARDGGAAAAAAGATQ